jgi:DNA repair ATPase RecN
MPNEDARQFIAKKVTALRITVQELTRIYITIGDLDLADTVRSRITDINETLFALESAQNSLEAATAVVPPPDAARTEALRAALHQLDTYVRNDQNIHMAINYLTQVAGMIGAA